MINLPDMQRTVELDVTLRIESHPPREIRKKASAIIVNLPRLPGDGKEGHALNLDFSQELEQDIRVGTQVTVASDGDILACHLVIFEGDFCFGRGFGWVPLKHTTSFAVAREDKLFSLDCCVSYRVAKSAQEDRMEQKQMG